MPMHDWTRVRSGIYHDFHQVWTIEIRNRLNGGVLPAGYIAMADQRVSGPEPDVVALKLRDPRNAEGGLAVADAPPRMRMASRVDPEAARYAIRANRIAIHQGLGRVVAMIEVVSPGNKQSAGTVASFVTKAVDFLSNGIHFLMIDPFPPGPRDPGGLARAIWDQLTGAAFEVQLPVQPLTVASFDAGDPLTAYVETLAIGDPLPETPLFLEPGWYVNLPLEATYLASWQLTPAPIRELVETPPSGSIDPTA